MSGTPYLTQPDLHAQAPHRAALLTYPGNLRKALKESYEDPKKTLFGFAHGIPSTFVTKLLASARPDFIWIDIEHGMWNRLELNNAIHAAQHHSEGQSLVVVRVPKRDELSLTTALDAGASGVIIPHVESAEEVRSMMKEIYYPPMGHRSFSPWTFTPGVSDASLYPGDNFNTRTSNDHIVIIPQIESVKGVENAEEIAAVPGVGALMFGPGDFSIDAGLPLKLGGEPHPKLLDALGKIGAAAKNNNLPTLAAAQTPDMIPTLIQQGCRVIAVGFDYWGLASMMSGALKQAREIASKEPEEANGHA